MRKNPVSSEVRIRVMKRDRFMCTYCGVSGNDAELEVDHIIPVALGGSNHMSNLTTACRKCNSEKSDKSYIAPISRSVVGHPVHIMKNGKINKQGEIVSASENNRYMVQLFSWIDGRPTIMEEIEKDDNMIIFANYEEFYRACKNPDISYFPNGRRASL